MQLHIQSVIKTTLFSPIKKLVLQLRVAVWLDYSWLIVGPQDIYKERNWKELKNVDGILPPQPEAHTVTDHIGSPGSHTDSEGKKIKSKKFTQSCPTLVGNNMP